MQFEKQEILIRVSFLYNRVESSVFLSHLKSSFSLKKSLFATIIKTKIAKNKATRKEKIINLLKINEVAITKKIVELHKSKNCRL